MTQMTGVQGLAAVLHDGGAHYVLHVCSAAPRARSGRVSTRGGLRGMQRAARQALK